MNGVVLVESNPVVRLGMVHLLEDAGLDVVAAVADASGIPSTGFGVLALDAAAEGPEATATIEAVDQRVLIVAESFTDVDLTELLDAGAHGVLLGASVSDLLVHAVESILAGGVFLDPHLVGRLVALMSRGQPGSGRHGLTTQERRVLSLLPGGRTNREIAEHLGIAVETVKTHLRNAMRKIGAYDRIDAARIVSEQGLDKL